MSTASATQYLSLDWRNTPSTSALIQRLEKFLGALDMQGWAGIVHSLGKHGVLVEQQDDTRMVLRRADTFSIHGITDEIFWRRAYALAISLGKMLASGENSMDRFLQYRESGQGLSKAQVKRIRDDLALSIGVHPWALGSHPEAAGHLVMPPMTYIDATIVTDMNAFRNRHLHNESGLTTTRWSQKKGGFQPIVSCILRIKISLGADKGGVSMPIRAVVVVEHRNLKPIIANYSEVPGVILVMTSGNASGAVKELLHMLDAELPTVPFLYIGDHDFGGFQIFYNLKYGSNDMAHCSHILVCPRLRWVGPSKADLEASPTAYKETARELHKQAHPHQSEKELDEIMAKWESEHKERIARKLDPQTKRDKAVYAGWEKDHIKWLQYEPVAKAEIELMRRSKAKFRLADMAVVGAAYLRRYVQQQVQLASPIVTQALIAPLPLRSPAPKSDPGQREYATQ